MLFLATLHAVPLGVVGLVWLLRWPQLVRPMTVALVAFVMDQLVIFWWELALALTFFILGVFLARAAWQSVSDFRRLVPHAGRRSPASRLLAGGFAWIVAFGFAVVPASWMIGLWEWPLGNQSWIDTLFQSKVAAAEAQLRAAFSLVRDDPQGAEIAWQRAVDQWEDLLRGSPSEPNYRVNLAIAHGNLGIVLGKQRKWAEAIPSFRKAIRIIPDDGSIHYNLGYTLLQQGRFDEAVVALRQAILLKPDHAESRINLGHALLRQGQLAGATAIFRQAIRLRPRDAAIQYHLGSALYLQGKKGDAIVAYRMAIDLEPGNAAAHVALAQSLRSQGDLDAAVGEFRKARDLAGSNPDLAQWIGRNLASAERQANLAVRLPSVVRGQDNPKDAAERLDFASACYHTRRFAASARLYSQAFGEVPELAEDVAGWNRYNAACAAALAAGGEGERQQPDTSAKARWRKQALEWLHADLAAWTKILQEGPRPNRQSIESALRHWKTDPDLGSLRDESELRRLPEDERRAFQALWSEVDALLSQAGIGTSQ